MDYNFNYVKDRLPKIDEIIKSEKGNRYRLIEALGVGGFGTVFKAYDESSDRTVALKAEQWSKTVLKIELHVLRATTKAASSKKNAAKHFCQLIDYGKQNFEYMFIVMSILGPDLSKLRNEQIDRKFTLSTATRIGIQTLSAIKELHKLGYLSRDIKPGNFAIGNHEDQLHRTIYMFDFGLSRKYIDKNNNILPSRGEVGWRGTSRYGSLQAHLRQDLGRKDDIESWFYALVEYTKGGLPWRCLIDRSQIEELKKYARGKGRKEFLSDCPKFYDQILSIIDGLSFASTPPYSDIHKLFDTFCKENNISMEQKYDWEYDLTASTQASLTAQVIYQPDPPQKKDLMLLKDSAIPSPNLCK